MKKKVTIERSKDFSQAEDFLNANFSSPTHWPDWNLVVSRHYCSDFYYYFAFERGELIGICPVHEEKAGRWRTLYSGQYNYIPYGGWIFKKEQEFCKFPLSWNESFTGFNFPINNNVISKQQYRKFQTLVIDLNFEGEDYEFDFNRNTKRNISKALNNNVSTYINNDVDLFYPYYEESFRTTGLKSMELSFLRDLMSSLKNISIDIIWAVKDNSQLGYLAIVYDKDYSFTWLTHNMLQNESLGQGHLLHLKAIKLSKEKGCKYFDLCYIEKERLPHIYQFKTGFSKCEVEVPVIRQKPLIYKLINRIIAKNVHKTI